MSSKSFLIDLTKSMIIIDPKDFPMNLGKNFREDAPTDAFPAQAFEAANVMPTAVGYKSFFNEANRFQLSDLPALTQRVYAYQSVGLDSILIAVGEYGIKISRPQQGALADWETIVDTNASAVVNVRRLWTSCVIANKVYLYQQGASRFYAIVDQASYDDAVTPSLIAGATRTRLWNKWNTGLLSYIPSFLNMAGQIGLFRAKNRLGFWDSDNAVAWSSAVAIEDFKPNAQTFAGVTKFTDVQGRINFILGSGDNFIIYATKSIIIARGLEGSPERWSGKAIMSSVGVAFDTQVAAAQPDQIQFCITQAGLLQIANGEPEYIATEVMDYLAKTSSLVSLTCIEGRYLFLHILEKFPASAYATESKLLTDADGDQFVFPKPTYPDRGSTEYWQSLLNGTNGVNQDAFEEFTKVEEVPEGQLLIPCYDVTGFTSTWDDITFEPDPEGEAYLDSKISMGVTYGVVEDYDIKPVISTLAYDTEDLGIDKAGEDLAPLVQGIQDKLTAHFTYQDDYINAVNSNSTAVFKQKFVTSGGPPTPETVVWEDELIDERRVFNLIDFNFLKLEDNKCDIHQYFERYKTFNIDYYFNGIEEYKLGGSIRYSIGVGVNVGGFIRIQQINGDSTLSFAPDFSIDALRVEDRLVYTEDDWDEYIAASSTIGFANNELNFLGWMRENKPHTCELSLDGYMNALAPWTCIDTIIAKCTSLINNWISRYPIGGSWRFTWQAGTPNTSPPANNLPADANGVTHPVWWLSNASTALNMLAHIKVDPRAKALNSAGDGTPKYAISGTIPGGGSSPYVPGENAWVDANLSFGGPGNSCTTTVGPGLYYTLSGASDGVNRVAGLQSPTYYADRDAAYGPIGDYPTGGMYTLTGTILPVTSFEEEVFETKNTAMELELTGWGYYPTEGAMFRKTHIRFGSTFCPLPTDPVGTTIPDSEDLAFNPPPEDGSVSYTPQPPYVWDYPDAIPLPPNNVLFQSGSLSPYYPTYKSASVFDLLLQKWGTYNNDHKGVYGLMPVNRVDTTIMPLPDRGMFAGAFTVDGKCTVFDENSPDSFIAYGKLGFYRRGMSFATEVRAHFNPVANGHVVVECSIDGVTINPDLSYAVDVTGQRNAILTFTRSARWFIIRVVGNFNLNYLELLAEEKSRR